VSNVPRAWKPFWAHPMELLGDVCQMEACFDLFAGCVNLGIRSVHGLRQMYMGMGVILSAPDGTPR
jgi:hypothetical protein